jgi:transcriptional regulator with XRE-family HTH domain
MNEIITKRIKSLRLIKGFSQDYVADKLSITQSA